MLFFPNRFSGLCLLNVAINFAVKSHLIPQKGNKQVRTDKPAELHSERIVGKHRKQNRNHISWRHQSEWLNGTNKQYTVNCHLLSRHIRCNRIVACFMDSLVFHLPCNRAVANNFGQIIVSVWRKMQQNCRFITPFLLAFCVLFLFFYESLIN